MSLAMLAPVQRVLEPEVMDTEEEARDYDAMDHRAVNARFCEDLLAEGRVGPNVLDVGAGTALIPIELCTRRSDLHVVAIDLADHMLALGRANIRRAGLDERVTLEKADAKRMPYERGAFSTTMSNSIVHHIPEPADVLSEIQRVTAPGGLVFVRDLARPSSEAEIDRLVALHAGPYPSVDQERASFERQRDLFRASLAAALTVDEIAHLAEGAGMRGAIARMTSDRHWTLVFRKDGP